MLGQKLEKESLAQEQAREDQGDRYENNGHTIQCLHSVYCMQRAEEKEGLKGKVLIRRRFQIQLTLWFSFKSRPGSEDLSLADFCPYPLLEEAPSSLVRKV